MSFSTDLNEQCLRLLTDGHADIELLKNTVQAGNREVLPRVTTSLWIARAYLADNQRREAEKLFRRIVELAPELHPARKRPASSPPSPKAATDTRTCARFCGLFSCPAASAFEERAILFPVVRKRTARTKAVP